MRVELKRYPEIGRTMYAVYPDGERLCAFENTLVTVLRDGDGREDIEELLRDEAFCRLMDRQRMILLFPNPLEGGWNWELDERKRDDLGDVVELVRLFNYQPGFRDVGLYHNMHNARYLVGVGSGASMVNAIAACAPVNVAGVVSLGGTVAARAAERSAGAPVAAVLAGASPETAAFFKALNQADKQEGALWTCPWNDAQRVLVLEDAGGMSLAEALTLGWRELFSKVCRPNACELGVMGPRTVRDDVDFIVHDNDSCLGDNGGIGHTWFEYVPESVKAEPERAVPLLIFCHGGADTPGNVANTIKFHEEAEKRGFLLVYPWASSHWGWNQNMEPDQFDDVAYLYALIEYMKRTHAVDGSRVYVGGFSNGSGMAQVFAMTNPEIVAGVIADNTRSFQDRNVKPFAIAGAKKLRFDYRMPVWYTYGTRDVEYPVVRGSGQQVQYDFWKSYNNIECKETPYIAEPAACGVGVEGDEVEVYCPNPRYPERRYTTHRFWSRDPRPLNLYNYSLAEGKGHDCNPEEAWLGWEYIRHFRRLPDGRLERTED